MTNDSSKEYHDIMMTLHDKHMPLYFQLQEAIRNKIAHGVYKPDEPIPTEQELQKEYEVSRETVRKAINDLVLAGLVEKRRGKGTFVARPKITHRIGRVYSSTEEVIARGMEPGTRFIKVEKMIPPDYIREEMGLGASDEIIQAKRLRLADDEPVAILISYLPYDLVPDLPDVKFVNNSLYHTLEEHYGLVLSECDEIIEAGLVDEEDASLLNIPTSRPVLVVSRSTHLDNGRVIEKLVAFYRSDRFKYRVRLEGRNRGQVSRAKGFN